MDDQLPGREETEQRMEEASGAGGSARYTLKPNRINNEDILFCIDVDAESNVEMKAIGPNGKYYSRLDCIKQAILLFMHSKLSINPDHRFALAILAKSSAWIKKEFSSNAESSFAALRGLTATSSCGEADLTLLFRAAAHEAKRSRAQNRILRVILIYCRSSIRPHHQWPVNQKLFTLDVMYLHDKPGPDNCPQEVYDSLVEVLEQVSEYEGYIHESGQGLVRTLYRYMAMLLPHPQQRCTQDDLDIPKSLIKRSSSADMVTGEDTTVQAVSHSVDGSVAPSEVSGPRPKRVSRKPSWLKDHK